MSYIQILFKGIGDDFANVELEATAKGKTSLLLKITEPETKESKSIYLDRPTAIKLVKHLRQRIAEMEVQNG